MFIITSSEGSVEVSGPWGVVDDPSGAGVGFNESVQVANWSSKLDFCDANAIVAITNENKQILKNVMSLFSPIQPENRITLIDHTTKIIFK